MLQRARAEPTNKRFLVHSELRITLPVIALLQNFSDNQTCIM